MRLLHHSLRHVAARAAAAVALAGGGLVAVAAPAQANHVAAMTVTQVANQGAYVTIQVDLSYTGAVGSNTFNWNTGNGRSGSVADGVSNGAYMGDGSGSGALYGGSGALGTFTWSRTQPATNVARTRITYAYPASGVYQVTWNDCCPSVNGTTAVSVSGSMPACSDAVDNDNDGNVDYPADAGCDDADDDSEYAECPAVVGVAVCLEPGDVEVTRVTPYSYDLSITPVHTVLGWIDLYDFNVGGVNARLACVTLASMATNACERAGGTFYQRVSALAVDAPVPAIEPAGPITTVGICEAELVATVLDIGVTGAPAYAICEAGNVHF